jgi:cytochrome b561
MAEADKDMKHLFHEVHEVLAFALIALIVIHLAAAIKHKLVGNVEISKRMSLLK